MRCPIRCPIVQPLSSHQGSGLWARSRHHSGPMCQGETAGGCCRRPGRWHSISNGQTIGNGLAVAKRRRGAPPLTLQRFALSRRAIGGHHAPSPLHRRLGFCNRWQGAPLVTFHSLFRAALPAARARALDAPPVRGRAAGRSQSQSRAFHMSPAALRASSRFKCS